MGGFLFSLGLFFLLAVPVFIDFTFTEVIGAVFMFVGLIMMFPRR